ALHARHALLEQHALDELGLGLVVRARHPHEVALGVLGLDLARLLPHLGHRLVDAGDAGVDERHLAARAEALVEREGARAARADQRLRGGDRAAHRTSSAASDTPPSTIRYARTSGWSPATPTITYSGSGQLRARLMSVCEGYGSVRVCEW